MSPDGPYRFGTCRAPATRSAHRSTRRVTNPSSSANVTFSSGSLSRPSDGGGQPSASPARPSELREASVLLLDDGHCFRDQALAFCAGAKTRELEFRATSLTTLTQMVAGGAGVTLLPQLAVPTEAQRAQLNVRAFASPVPHRTIALIWRRRSPFADALRKIAGTIRAAYPRPGARPLRARARAGQHPA